MTRLVQSPCRQALPSVGGADAGRLPAVLHPLVDVARHVVQTELVGELAAHGLRSVVAVLVVPGDLGPVSAPRVAARAAGHARQLRPAGNQGRPSSPWRNPALHRERRGARLARRDERAYQGICERGATQPAGMDRRSNAAGVSPRAASVRRRRRALPVCVRQGDQRRAPTRRGPVSTNANPMTYRARFGRQFVVIATGAGQDAALVAFARPE